MGCGPRHKVNDLLSVNNFRAIASRDVQVEIAKNRKIIAFEKVDLPKRFSPFY